MYNIAISFYTHVSVGGGCKKLHACTYRVGTMKGDTCTCTVEGGTCTCTVKGGYMNMYSEGRVHEHVHTREQVSTTHVEVNKRPSSMFSSAV